MVRKLVRTTIAMKLPKFLLGVFLLCNWQFIAPANATPEENIPAQVPSSNRLLAQITPDATLGNEGSTVVPDAEVQGVPAELIEGGAERGANLFHSFQEFNVGNGQSVYFANPEGIANIFSRITGNDVSDILGTLGVNGGADLFLINPNGIIFGENASLDVNGSFLATTASEVQFGEEAFSATNPNAPPLLTVQPSALLFNQMQSGRIESRSVAPAGTSTLGGFEVFGLRVPDGENLSLIGGEVTINGGMAESEFRSGLIASDGRIELLGVAGAANIGLSTNGNSLASNLSSQLQSADIVLSNGAFLTTSGEAGGAISIRGENVTLSDQSFVFADTIGSQDGIGVSIRAENLTLDNSQVTADVLGSGQGGNVAIETEQLIIQNQAVFSTSNFGQGNAGSIDINANGNVSVDNSFILSLVSDAAMGDAGNINISTNSLSATESALDAGNLGQGNAGSVNINAANNISVDNSFILSLISDAAMGDAGNINISTNSLSTVGSMLDASNLGQGNAGSVNINAAGNVSVGSSSILSVLGSPIEGSSSGGININAESLSVSNTARLDSSLVNGGRGRAGNITIDAGNVVFNNGFATSRLEQGAEGRGGNIRIDTGSLRVTGVDPSIADANIGQLVTATFGRGDAGNVIINASGNVAFNGRGSDVFSLVGEDRGIGNGGNIIINSESLSVSNLARLITVSEAFGDAGNIMIDTDSFSVANGGQLSTNSTSTAESNTVDGSSEGGDIDITARSFVANDGLLNAGTSVTGNAGNINLQVQDLLSLRNNSNIVTNAGIEGAGGDGGNININTSLLATIPQENSDITANAFAGRGGLIQIAAEAVVGFQSSTQLTNLSDITAFSQQNPQLNGEIILDVSDINLSQDSLNIPVETTNTEIAQTCEVNSDGNQSNFVVTGRGGLPESPEASLDSVFGLEDWRVEDNNTMPVSRSSDSLPKDDTEPTKPTIEADSWIINRQGKVLLVATERKSLSNKLMSSCS